MRGFLIIFTSVILLPLVVFVHQANAQIIDKKIERSYVMDSDRVHVTEKITTRLTNANYIISEGSEEVFLVFNPLINDSDAQDKIDQTIPTISVKDNLNNPLKFTTEVDGQHLLIKVVRPYSVTTEVPQVIIAEYDSFALQHRNGAIYDMYIPSFARDFMFTDETTTRLVTTSVVIPKSFGTLGLITPNKAPVELDNSWELNFSQEELTDTISWIQIGTTQYYEFNIVQPYKASTSIPIFFNTYTIILPRNIHSGPVQQKVYFENISPQPESVVEDDNGNLVASFVLPANVSGEIKASGYVVVSKDPTIDVTNSGVIDDIPTNIISKNTSSAEFWEVDSDDIQSVAKELKGSETNVYKIIEKTYSFVIDKIDYSEVKRFGLNERQGALKTLQGGAAVCMEYSDLFIALLRAQGVPARAAFGYGYDSRSTQGVDIAHQWAEVYIPSIGQWIGIDTTWGESGPALIGGDVNHLYKYIASQDPHTPVPVESVFFGVMERIPSEVYTISTRESLPNNPVYTSYDDLLKEYPPKSDIQSTINNIHRTISYSITSANNGLKKVLEEKLNLSEQASRVIRTAIYVSPLLLLCIYTSWRIYKRVSNKRSKTISVAIVPGHS